MTARIVAAARGWIGTPYVHQGSVRGAGADCLGLVRGVWREVVGAEPEAVPPYAPDWSEPSGREDLLAAIGRWFEPVSALEEGTVVLLRMREAAVAKHLGIVSVAGDAPCIIHAYSGRGVVESPLSAPWQRRIVAMFRMPER